MLKKTIFCHLELQQCNHGRVQGTLTYNDVAFCRYGVIELKENISVAPIMVSNQMKQEN